LNAGKIYKEPLYQFGEDGLADGILIQPLIEEDITLTIHYNGSGMNLLRMFSLSAKENRHTQHPGDPVVYLQRAIPWRVAKKVFQAMNDDRS
jgi:hypothetical protein